MTYCIFGKFKNVVCHCVVVVLNHTLFIEKSGRTVTYGMEQIRTGPVKYRHKVVTDNLYTKFRKIAYCLNIVFNVLITSGKTNFDIVVNINRFNNVNIKTVLVTLRFYLCDFFFTPDFAGHFVVKCPNNSRHTWDLLDVLQ